MLVTDPLNTFDRLAIAGAVAEFMRSARETDASVAASAQNDQDGVTGRIGRQETVTVDLIPGSHRLVTTILDPENGAVLLRIPAWLSNIEELVSLSSSPRAYL